MKLKRKQKNNAILAQSYYKLKQNRSRGLHKRKNTVGKIRYIVCLYSLRKYRACWYLVCN